MEANVEAIMGTYDTAHYGTINRSHGYAQHSSDMEANMETYDYSYCSSILDAYQPSY
jgi:hypothetical protein